MVNKEDKGISLDRLSAYYDLLTPTDRSRLRRRQITMAGIRPGETVLDVGCGTGSLTFLAKLAVGQSGTVSGIDLAPGMIRLASEKAKRAGLKIDFQAASIDEIPYPDKSFDLVTSSMMFHHLPVKIKEKGLVEIHRVLKPWGRVFISDI